MTDATHTVAERSGLSRFTSIARPIDPSYVTNKALLYLLPLLGVLSAVIAWASGNTENAAGVAFSGVLVAFIAWALTRDLAPDFVEASFIALACAWLGSLTVGTGQVLTAFAVLLLIRVVNRCTGLPLTWFDTFSVLGFITYTALQTDQPLLVLVMAVAFAGDAFLNEPLRRHAVAALLCMPLFVWVLATSPGFAVDSLAAIDWIILSVSLLGGVLLVTLSPEPISYYDNAYDRLDRYRVSAGFIVGLLAGLQTVVTLGPTAWFETPIWACLSVVLVSFAVRRLREWRAATT
ncbi:MAG: hypothetical protein AAGA33_00225 [Pseudomonadota bacterium]